MAEVAFARDEWYVYIPIKQPLLSPSYLELPLSEEEERWIWEAYKEWEEVQKFIAGRESERRRPVTVITRRELEDRQIQQQQDLEQMRQLAEQRNRKSKPSQ